MAGGCRNIRSALPELVTANGLIDLRLSSGDLLLEHIRKIALALDRKDQCKGGRYLQRQLYYAALSWSGWRQRSRRETRQNISNYVSGDSDKMFPLQKLYHWYPTGAKFVLIPI